MPEPKPLPPDVLLAGAYTDRGYEDKGKLIRRIPIKLPHK